MYKLIVLFITMLLVVGCETGVQNKGKEHGPVLSGIVDRNDIEANAQSIFSQKSQASTKQGANKIFSRSGQPGYYLQVAFFTKSNPSKSFLQPIESAGFGYTVLEKHNGKHVLIGPYKSYNSAKSQIPAVKSKLKKQTFVVQVLRPDA